MAADMRIRSWIACLVLLATLTSGGVARAQDADACILANEKALALRKAEKLIAARASLSMCAASTCPDAVRTSCQQRVGGGQPGDPEHRVPGEGRGRAGPHGGQDDDRRSRVRRSSRRSLDRARPRRARRFHFRGYRSAPRREALRAASGGAEQARGDRDRSGARPRAGTPPLERPGGRALRPRARGAPNARSGSSSAASAWQGVAAGGCSARCR